MNATPLVPITTAPALPFPVEAILLKHGIEQKELPNHVHDIEHVEGFGKVLFVVILHDDTYYFNAKCRDEITDQIESSYPGQDYDPGDRHTAPAGGGSFEDHKEAVGDDITREWLFSNLDKWILENEG